MTLLAHQARLMGGAGSVFDPSAKHADITLSDGNAAAQGGAAEAYRTVYGAQGRAAGVLAFDIVVVSLPSPSSILVGLADKTNVASVLATYIGNNSGSVETIGYNDNNNATPGSGSGRVYRRMTVGSTSGTLTDRINPGDRITVLASIATNKARFYRNGAAISVGLLGITSGKTYYPAVSLQKSAKVQIVTRGLPFLPAGASEWG